MATKPKGFNPGGPRSRPGARRAPAPRATAKPKPKRYTAAQNKSFKAWVKKHPFKNNGFTAGSGTKTATKPRAAVGSMDMVSEYGWVRGLNEEYPTCVATAIANSLLTVRGIRATDDQVMRLHYHSGAASGDGVSIADALGAVMDCGLAGVRPVAYFAIVREPSFGSILGMTDGKDDHAVTVTSSGLISWGVPLPDELANAWMLDGEAWHVQW